MRSRLDSSARAALLAFVLVGGSVAGASLVGACRKAAPLPTMGAVPAFALRDQTNKSVSLDDYRGGVWVADFVFTRCKESCPMLTTRMKLLGKLLDEEASSKGAPPVRLVSFSVDPEYDTPDRLGAYANGFGAQPGRWAFLTGDTARIRDLVSQGFKLGVTPLPREDGVVDIVHSNRFVLVDKAGAIRGYYDAESPDEMQRLAVDAVGLSRP